MKVFFLLTLTIIQLSTLINAVPDHCGNGVKYAYPGDNTKFIICENHIPLAQKCPVGTTFNANVQVCDTSVVNTNRGRNPETVNAAYSSVPYNPNPQVVTTGQNIWPLVNNGHTNTVRNRVDPNLGNDYGQQRLTGSDHSNHHYTPSFPANSISSTTQRTQNNRGLQSPNNNQNNGQNYNLNSNSNNPSSANRCKLPNQQNIQSNTAFNKHPNYNGNGGNCNDDKNINLNNNAAWLQNQNHGLDQSHINLNVIEGSTGHAASSCNNAASGSHIAFPGDCTKFIVCSADGTPVVKDCAPNTHFNPYIQVCDWPQSAGCAYKKYH